MSYGLVDRVCSPDPKSSMEAIWQAFFAAGSKVDENDSHLPELRMLPVDFENSTITE